MKTKKFFSFIPNTITSFNALSGTLAVVCAFDNNLVLAGILIIIAAVFDFFDGMSARLLGAYSDMGKELDSLADMVSFGLAPGVIAHMLVRNQIWEEKAFVEAPFVVIMQLILPFIIVVFSALRLAKFNIDTRQTDSFIGLATPANALVWASLPFVLAGKNSEWVVSVLQNPWVVIALSVLLSLLLVAELPMFSLKFKSLSFNDNKTRFVFLFICLLLIIVFKVLAVPLIIITYILISVIQKLFNK